MYQKLSDDDRSNLIEVGKKICSAVSVTFSIVSVILISVLVPAIKSDTNKLQIESGVLQENYPVLTKQMFDLSNTSGNIQGSISMITNFLGSVSDIQSKIKLLDNTQADITNRVETFTTKFDNISNSLLNTESLIKNSQMLLNISQNQMLTSLNQTAFLSGQISYIYNLISQLNDVQGIISELNKSSNRINQQILSLNNQVSNIQNQLNFTKCVKCGYIISGQGFYPWGSYLINNISFDLCGYMFINGSTTVQFQQSGPTTTYAIYLTLLGNNITVSSGTGSYQTNTTYFSLNMSFTQCYENAKLYIDVSYGYGVIQVMNNFFSLSVTR